MNIKAELSDTQISTYNRQGYLLIPSFFSREEIAPFQKSLKEDPSVGGYIQHIHDGEKTTRDDHVNGYRLDYIGWYKEGNDWLGMATRLERVVIGARQLIGEEVYHYHSKLARKPAGGSGSLMWHQDYGGWYQDGCLLPEMLTCVVALTESNCDSGCLRFLKGSHTMGRVDRIPSEHAYANINPLRLAGMREQFEEISLEMKPGDGLFFHGNLVHSSGPNSANYDRWLLQMSYNGISNAPVFEKQEHHAAIPIEIAPDNALRDKLFDGIYSDTPLQDLTNPEAEGATIYYRNSFPLLS